jgi:hypothetical protein
LSKPSRKSLLVSLLAPDSIIYFEEGSDLTICRSWDRLDEMSEELRPAEAERVLFAGKESPSLSWLTGR